MNADIFTFAPTVNLTASPAHNFVVAHKVDHIQARFNMTLVNAADWKALLPISNSLYDLFCAYEVKAADADQMAFDLLAAMKAHALHDTAVMQEAIISLADALEGEMPY